MSRSVSDRSVDKHLTTRMFFTAFTHCSLARIPGLSSDKLTLCISPVISDRKVIGHSCSTVPWKISWCGFHSVHWCKTHQHRALLLFAHKGHHTHTLSLGVKRCTKLSCCASSHICASASIGRGPSGCNARKSTLCRL